MRPEKWPDALTTISNALNAAGTLLYFQRADGSYSMLHSPSLDNVVNDFFTGGWATRDIRAIRSQEAGVFGKQTIVTDADVFTEEEMNTLPFYTELLAPHKLRWCMAASVSPDPKEYVVFSVQQYATRGAFDQSSQKRLELLASHAERSLRLSCHLMRAELANTALGDALNRVGCAVVLLDATAKPVFSNALGRNLAAKLGRYSIGDAWPNPLRAPQNSSGIAALAAEIQQVNAHGPSANNTPILMQNEAGERTVVYVLPVTKDGRSTLEVSFGDVNTIVVAMTQQDNQPVDPAIVRDMLGITLGEARVASLVGAGFSPREAAGKLGIAEDTARTVLKRVFSKVNVSKQSQLAILLTQLSFRQL
ncbi:MAG: helix-turn-helix transcriptional regulator [Hyphomicrobium sp.]